MAKKKPKPPKLDYITEPLRSLAVPIDSLSEDPRNARTHDAANLRAVAASLKSYGQLKPIVVNAENQQIVAGNGTWRAALALGWKQIAVVLVKMDAAAQAGFSVADNRTAELADWDDELLALRVEEIKTAVPDLYDDLLLAELVKQEVAAEREGGIQFADSYQVVVELSGEEEQQRLFEELKGRGLRVKVLTL